MKENFKEYYVLYENWLTDMPGRDESWTVYLKRLGYDSWHIVVDSTDFNGDPLEDIEEYTLATSQLSEWADERDSWITLGRDSIYRVDEAEPRLMELVQGYVDYDGDSFDPRHIGPHESSLLLIADRLGDKELFERLRKSAGMCTPEEYEKIQYDNQHPTYDIISGDELVIFDAKYQKGEKHFGYKFVMFYAFLHKEKIVFGNPNEKGLLYYLKGWGTSPYTLIASKDTRIVQIEPSTVEKLHKIAERIKKAYDIKKCL